MAPYGTGKHHAQRRDRTARRLALQTRALPQPAAGEVRVKVKFAGICGSDVHIYHGHNPFARYPRVIGHEFFGLIDALGEGVDPARSANASR